MPVTELDIPLGPGVALVLPDGTEVRLCWKYDVDQARKVNPKVIRLGLEAPRHVDIVRDEMEWKFPGRPLSEAKKPAKIGGWRAIRLAKAGKLRKGAEC